MNIHHGRPFRDRVVSDSKGNQYELIECPIENAAFIMPLCLKEELAKFAFRTTAAPIPGRPDLWLFIADFHELENYQVFCARHKDAQELEHVESAEFWPQVCVSHPDISRHWNRQQQHMHRQSIGQHNGTVLADLLTLPENSGV